jgi:esterase/lipase superfamily enzyme
MGEARVLTRGATLATGGRRGNFSLLFGAGGVRVSFAYGRSGAGEAMNKKIRSSGGLGQMLTGLGGWRIFSGRNAGSSKIIDRYLHSTYVVNNILIGSLFSICRLQGHLFFVFSFPYYFSDKISIIDLY